MTNENSSLPPLVLKRGQLKAQMTRFQNFLDGFTLEKDGVEAIQKRLSKIENILDEYEEIQNSIEILSNYEVQAEERQAFEDAFYAVTERAGALLRKLSTNSNLNTAVTGRGSRADFESDGGETSKDAAITVPDPLNLSNSDIINISSKVKLPSISLPDFHGFYNQWMTFHDTFSTLIHNNQQLSNIQKFYYLQSCLKGEAAQLIHSIEISNSNYDIAWSMLKERYENKKLIISTHMKAIFELVPVKFESHVQLRKLLDNFNKNFRALTALGQPTEQWDTPIIYTLTSKLDPISKREWE